MPNQNQGQIIRVVRKNTTHFHIISTVIFSVIATTISAAAFAATIPAGNPTDIPCKQNANGMWGDVNPNIFYICNETTNTAIVLPCPEGRGFFNGKGYYGCIPYEHWPACISVTNLTQICDNEHLLQPWETANPNKFYMCMTEVMNPVLVNCEAGKGFVHAELGNSKILGCAQWEKWRSYMNCMDYY